MSAQFPSGVYDPPHDGLPYIGLVVVAPGDVRMQHFVLKSEALSFVEHTVAKLLIPGGQPRS
jgi:hypothetical protein